MTVPFLPPAAIRRTGVPVLRSRARWRVQTKRLTLAALTGQAPTLTRTTTATFVDSAGATVTAAHSMPRWEPRTLSGASLVGLLLSTEDLTYPLDFAPEQASVYLDFVQNTAAPANNAGLLYLGRNDQTGNRLVIRGTGTTVAVDLVTGGGTVTATLGTSVAATQRVRLVVQVDDDGTNQRVRIGGEVAGTPVAFSAWSSTVARAASWGTGALLRLNRVGSAGAQNTWWWRDGAWFAGLLTLAEIDGRL